MQRLFVYMLVGLTMTFSCTKDVDKQAFEYKKQSMEKEFSEEIKQTKEIFSHLYLPVEMSNMFDSIQQDFDPTILLDLTKTKQIIFSNEIALAIGMYGVNLGYIRLYSNWNLANEYFHAIKDLTENVGISNEVFKNISVYMDKKVNNKDTLEMYANEVYILTDYSLRDSGRDNTSALIIVGGWLEAMHMAINIYEDTGSKLMLDQICKQINSLKSVIKLLELMKNSDATANYLEQLKDMHNILAGLNAAHILLVDNLDSKYTDEVVMNYLQKIKSGLDRMLEFAL